MCSARWRNVCDVTANSKPVRLTCHKSCLLADWCQLPNAGGYHCCGTSVSGPGDTTNG